MQSQEGHGKVLITCGAVIFERFLDFTSTPLMLALAADLPNLTRNLIRTIFSRCEGNPGAIPRINGKSNRWLGFTPSLRSRGCRNSSEKSNAARNFATGGVAPGLVTFIGLPTDHADLFVNGNSMADPQSVTRQQLTPGIVHTIASRAAVKQDPFLLSAVGMLFNGEEGVKMSH